MREVDHDEVLRIIEEAGKLISDPANFCQGALSRSKGGRPCHPGRGSAWDAAGAVMAVWSDPRGQGWPPEACAAMATIQLASAQLYRRSVEVVADELGHRDVVTVLRRAWRVAKSNTI